MDSCTSLPPAFLVKSGHIPTLPLRGLRVGVGPRQAASFVPPSVGHGRAGALPDDHVQLLPRSPRDHHRVRRDRPGEADPRRLTLTRNGIRDGGVGKISGRERDRRRGQRKGSVRWPRRGQDAWWLPPTDISSVSVSLIPSPSSHVSRIRSITCTSGWRKSTATPARTSTS